MPYDLLLLPLLGGYWFCRTWHYTNFALQQTDRLGTLLYSATVGVGLLLGARPLVLAIEAAEIPLEWFIRIAPWSFSGTAICSALAAYPLAKLFNAFGQGDKQALASVLRFGDEIERIFARSVSDGEFLDIAFDDGTAVIAVAGELPAAIRPGAEWVEFHILTEGHCETGSLTPTYPELDAAFDALVACTIDFEIRVFRVSDIRSVAIFNMDPHLQAAASRTEYEAE